MPHRCGVVTASTADAATAASAADAALPQHRDAGRRGEVVDRAHHPVAARGGWRVASRVDRYDAATRRRTPDADHAASMRSRRSAAERAQAVGDAGDEGVGEGEGADVAVERAGALGAHREPRRGAGRRAARAGRR